MLSFLSLPLCLSLVGIVIVIVKLLSEINRKEENIMETIKGDIRLLLALWREGSRRIQVPPMEVHHKLLRIAQLRCK